MGENDSVTLGAGKRHEWAGQPRHRVCEWSGAPPARALTLSRGDRRATRAHARYFDV